MTHMLLILLSPLVAVPVSFIYVKLVCLVVDPVVFERNVKAVGARLEAFIEKNRKQS